jgi:hypothetical protein
VSFLDKARQAAEQARAAASHGIHDVTTPEVKAQMREAAATTGSGLREAAGAAGRGLVTAVEKIDPGILADIIKATALQEKTNRSLRVKASAYRIGEVTISATIPPQIGFSIVRIGDPEEDATSQIQSSGDLVEGVATVDEEVVSLSGEVEPIEPDR